MKIKRDNWKKDVDLVEEWLEQSHGYSRDRGIEADIRNLRTNMAIMLLELNKDKVLEICEDKTNDNP